MWDKGVDIQRNNTAYFLHIMNSKGSVQSEWLEFSQIYNGCYSILEKKHYLAQSFIKCSGA